MQSRLAEKVSAGQKDKLALSQSRVTLLLGYTNNDQLGDGAIAKKQHALDKEEWAWQWCNSMDRTVDCHEIRTFHHGLDFFVTVA